MGTNYYHRTNICDCCNRYDEKHIGKSSAGWQFSFQGYEDAPEILSYKDWLRVLWQSLMIDKTGKIFNEYNKEMSYDDFVEMVKKKQSGPHNQYDEVQKECKERGYSIQNDWKDEEGYAFTFAEFS